jgi:hypothetical protein
LALPSGHGGLDVDGAAHRILRGSERDEHAIAGGLYDAAAAPLDLGIDHLAPMHLLSGEHVILVLFHQAGIACHVGREDGGKAAIHHFLQIRDLPAFPSMG